MIKVYFDNAPDKQLTKAHPDDAGYDLRSSATLDVPPGEVVLVPTGVYASLPVGVVALVKSRSGLALKKNVGSDGGVIDAGYRGEYGVILRNYGKETFHIERGDRVAQVLFMQLVGDCIPMKVVDSKDELGPGSRGECGYGSTGVQK